MKIVEYTTLQQIVDQLKSCDYNTEEGGPLVKNIAFIALKKMAKKEKEEGDLIRIIKRIHTEHIRDLNGDQDDDNTKEVKE